MLPRRGALERLAQGSCRQKWNVGSSHRAHDLPRPRAATNRKARCQQEGPWASGDPRARHETEVRKGLHKGFRKGGRRGGGKSSAELESKNPDRSASVVI